MTDTQMNAVRNSNNKMVVLKKKDFEKCSHDLMKLNIQVLLFTLARLMPEHLQAKVRGSKSKQGHREIQDLCPPGTEF